ncbi:RBBP9/YdeN family alpha/beta hydrolase [Vibrio nitrifigilis]|uniref:Alpha/beta hydrolase n=1 Tax=Vibrio nitrifigilis TaxID=2789781 RepID=A0ABS0GD41_9VIBR|nr:alpha/beta hydrolase [Vibrio nitrifigilis]MBF9000319.1 alpha/beta hydrolase [Vibrio nitrifigilis]
MSVTVIISPGYGDSSPDHWQTWLNETLPNSVKVEQINWLSPQRDEWIDGVQRTVESVEGPIILVGHSCGSVAVTQWAQRYADSRVLGAILVAPADVDDDYAMEEIKVQRPLMLAKLPFPTVVVCSDNDIHVSVERAHYFAECWGSKAVHVLNQAGHINADNGYGSWPQMLEWIEELAKAW